MGCLQAEAAQARVEELNQSAAQARDTEVTARRDVADLSQQVTERTSELQQIDQRIQEARQNLMSEQQSLAQLREQIAQQAAELQALEQRREAPAPPEQPAAPAQQ